MPKIVNIEGLYQLPDDVNALGNSGRFNYIYESGLWLGGAGGESRSGSGRTKENTQLYAGQLTQYLEVFKKSISKESIKFFDAPCGDLNWIRGLISDSEYVGGDISEKLIADLNQLFPQVEAHRFDITEDRFPEVDVWHCRHCHFHLSLNDVAKSLEGFCNSTIDVALLTNHFLPDCLTFDIQSGSFRPLDLTNYPFYLPEPQLWLLDSQPLSGKTAMATGVWSRSQIKVGIDNYYELLNR